jgi:hypothetical protein
MRGHWHALNNFVCVKHAVPLFTSPTSYTEQTRWDFTSYCRDHVEEFDAAVRNAVVVELHPYDRYFGDRLTGSPEPHELLDPLPYHVAYRLCEIVGRIKLFEDGMLQTPVETGRLHPALREGFDILSEKQKLLSLLTDMRGKHLRRSKSSSRYFIYGSLQKYLTYMADVDGIRPLVDLVRDHAMETLPIGPEDNFLGGGGVRKWHSLRTAKLKLNIDSRTMRKMADERGLIGPAQTHLLDNEIVLPAGEVEHLAEEYQRAVDLQYVRAELGILEVTARTLVRAGILKPVVGLTPGMKPKFKRSDVDRLLDDLTQGAIERADTKGLVSLVDASRKGGGSVANIIIALVAGKFRTRYLSSDSRRTGLMRLLLDLTEVRKEFVLKGGIKRQDFVKAFPFRPLEVDKLFYSDFFERVRETSPTNHVRYDAVTVESFERFQRDHISLAKLAVGWARPTDVKLILDQAEVQPVWEIKGRRALTFYRLKDVASLRPKPN